MRHFDTVCGNRCAYLYRGATIFASGGVGVEACTCKGNREYNHDISIAICESNHDMRAALIVNKSTIASQRFAIKFTIILGISTPNRDNNHVIVYSICE